MAGYDLERQVTGFGGITEYGCCTVAGNTSGGTFAAKTVAVPTRLSKLVAGGAISDTTDHYLGLPLSVCTGGWLDFTFADSTMTGFRYWAVGW